MTEPREVEDWADWELDILEGYYCLMGGEWVRSRLACQGVERSAYSIRHKASRLNLAEEMTEFTPARDVAQEAGVSVGAVLNWLRWAGHRRHCRTWGKEVLLPLPAVRLYLHAQRRDSRPAGWLSPKRVAAQTGLTERRVQQLCTAGQLQHAQVGNMLYICPHSAAQLPQPPAGYVPVALLCKLSGTDRHAAQLDSVTVGQHDKAPHYVSQPEARRFLSARGHHAEQVETLLRKALAMQVTKLKR